MVTKNTQIMPKSILQKSGGYIAAEWVILTFVMVMALFAPIPGQEQSVAGLLMSAIRGFYSNMTLLLSLP